LYLQYCREKYAKSIKLGEGGVMKRIVLLIAIILFPLGCYYLPTYYKVIKAKYDNIQACVKFANTMKILTMGNGIFIKCTGNYDEYGECTVQPIDLYVKEYLKKNNIIFEEL
jgi:hypothetical protein